MLQQNSSDFSSVYFHLGAMMGYILLFQGQEKKVTFTFPNGQEGYLERWETKVLFCSLSVFWPFKISPQSTGVLFTDYTNTHRNTHTFSFVVCLIVASPAVVSREYTAMNWTQL